MEKEMRVMKHTILVPVDGSKNGERSLRYACWLADKLAASVTILYVVTIPRITGDPLSREDLIERSEFFGRTILDEARKIAEEEGCNKIEEELRRGIGNPGHEVVQFSKDGAFSLIVMGARGHTVLTHLLLGSVSDVVVHHAHCPVLIVR